MTAITAWGVSEIAVSASFLPFTALVAILSPRLGSLADRYGPGPLIAAGAGIVAVAFAGMAATAPAALFWSATVPLMALMGLGMSLVVAPLSTAVMGAVPEEESGAASGINNAVSRTAGLVAVAAMGPVASAAYGAAGGPESFGEPAASAGHAAASSAGFAAVAWLTTGIAAFSALLSLFFIRRV